MLPQNPARFVTVLNTVMATLVPSQMSLPVGGVNIHVPPHSTVSAAAQFNTGAVVSTTVMVWLHVAAFIQASVARHVRVAL